MANRKRSFVDTQLSLGSTNADSVQSADMEERDYRTPLPQKPLQWKRRKDDRSLLSYFIKKDRNNNRSFFWDNEWDQHRLTCTFWADKQMQLDYSFGDSVYFDTTYRSIETCRPLGETDEGFVTVDSANGELSCSCCLFDSSGWLCRHALKVMQQSPIYNDHNMLRATVSQYIMERWTKKAKSIGELSALKLVDGPLLYTLRDQHLVTMLGRLDRRVERHEKAYNMVYYGVSALMKCARDLIESTSVNSESS
ncbi:Protein FAR-RED ELONGATED HYPOCOTYL 3 [Linum perenne]